MYCISPCVSLNIGPIIRSSYTRAYRYRLVWKSAWSRASKTRASSHRGTLVLRIGLLRSMPLIKHTTRGWEPGHYPLHPTRHAEITGNLFSLSTYSPCADADTLYCVNNIEGQSYVHQFHPFRGQAHRSWVEVQVHICPWAWDSRSLCNYACITAARMWCPDSRPIS